MPQLLLEFFSEEIPARMQKRAEEDLARLLHEKFLVGTGHADLRVATFSSPRRIGAVVDGLKVQTDEPIQVRKGPKVGAPTQAIEGFLKSTGLKSIDDAQIKGEPGKQFYEATYRRPSLSTADVLQTAIPEIVRAFPWPKSMRSQASDLQWVRPLHNICCIFDGKPVKIAVDGVGSEGVTWGHRFHAPEAMPVTSASDHASKLRGAKVLIERDERKQIILDQAKKLCAAKGLELVDDIGLLEEVAGLVEWPVTLLGDMDPAFLDLPGEVIRLSMRTHQKYFAVRDPKTQKLAPHFITVANVEAKDGGKAIAAGNARVLSARLNDARFFWDTDKKTPLDTPERRAKLEKIVFHQKLGSVWDKVERVKALAAELCAVTGADVEQVKRAAELCKMDLVTETVGEFPELQGQVGRQLYLAELSAPLLPRGEGAGDEGRSNAQAPERRNAPHPPTPSPQGRGGDESIAAAIEDHYRPLGPNDRVPEDKVAITLALADKLDTLAAFWVIGERPTGSGDPYALRRAALGVIRTVVENRIRGDVLISAFLSILEVGSFIEDRALTEARSAVERGLDALGVSELNHRLASELARKRSADREETRNERFLANLEIWVGVRDFVLERMEPYLRDQGVSVGVVRAGSSVWQDFSGWIEVVDSEPPAKFIPDPMLNRIVARVEALDAFLKSQDGANLLAGYKRAANILAAEEKKGKWSAADAKGDVDASKLIEAAEKTLHAALESAIPTARSAVEREDFAAAMKALSGLRAPVDAFFEDVLVNADDANLRRNRLLLLSRLREALSQVADFSKIEG